MTTSRWGVDGTEQTSRTKLLAVPYAMKSADAQALRAELQTLGVLPPTGMVSVLGGTLPVASQLAGQVVAAFYIGKYETTWAEWQTVRTYGVANGYDLTGVGNGAASTHPVEEVNWYDVVKWCNAKSEQEGLVPVYTVSGATYKTGESDPTVNANANGYRLPTEAEWEWEWAARGGVR